MAREPLRRERGEPCGGAGDRAVHAGDGSAPGPRAPFNPAEAILASSDYLKELEREFGSLGLAAAAYNAGEERVARYLAGETGLPGETRAYVVAITGHPAEIWRDGPLPTPDLSLDSEVPFREACLDMAVARDFPSFTPPAPEEPVLLPWGVILATHGSREAAERQAAEVASLIPGERIDYVHAQVPGRRVQRHIAQVGRETREAARELCNRLRAEGAACMVLRN